MSIPQNFLVYASSNIVIMDAVTFCFKFSDGEVAGGHSDGPVFQLGAAKVVLNDEQADQLIAAGVRDVR